MFSGLTARGPRETALAVFLGVTLTALGSLGCAPAAYHETHVSIGAYVSDYDYLDDYGEWIYMPPYGRVWHPYVVASWRPFFHGHWIWTDWGWMWVSYEPFGWLVYHYGYWDWHPRIGWIWIPGTRWSPARVRWMIYGDYCAWTPMPPPRAYWPDPWDSWYIDVWIVVDARHFTDDHVGQHHIPKPVFREIHKRNVERSSPSVNYIERIAKKPVPLVKAERAEREIRPDAVRRPPRPGQPLGTKLRSVALPESEKSRVKEYAPKVEREVLQPRSTQPSRETPAPQQERERTKEKRETREKQTPSRRTTRR